MHTVRKDVNVPISAFCVESRFDVTAGFGGTWAIVTMDIKSMIPTSRSHSPVLP